MRIIKPDSPRLEDVVPLNTHMSPQDAIKNLASFHNTTEDAILRMFHHLRDSEGAGTVQFVKDEHGLKMEGFFGGRWQWFHALDDETGQLFF